MNDARPPIPSARRRREGWGRWVARARLHPTWLLALALGALALVVFWPMLGQGRVLLLDDIHTSDLWMNNVPPRAFLGAELRQGRFPLWIPGMYGGLPLLPQGEAAAGNPITWVLFAALSPARAVAASLALHAWLAGLGAALLGRRLGLRAGAALVSGVSFMLCGFLVAHAKHLNLHHTAAWLPWLLLTADLLRERPGLTRALALGAVGALQVSEGHPQMAYVSLFALAPLLGVRALADAPLRARWRGVTRAVGGFVLAGLAALGTAAVLSGGYVVAALELLSASERWATEVDRFQFCTRFEFFEQNWLTLFWPYLLGDASDASYHPRNGIFWESWLYVGVLPALAAVASLGLAIAAVRRHGPRPLVWVATLGAIAAVSAVLMRGGASSLYRVMFDHVPGASWFRFPHRFGLLVDLSVALLAGLGVELALRFACAGRRRRAAMLSAACVLCTALDLRHVMERQLPTADASAMNRPESARVLDELAAGAPYRVFSAFATEAHVEAFDAAKGWAGSLDPYLDQWELLQPSLNVLFGVDAINGYTSMIPRSLGLVLSSQTIPGELVSPATHAAVADPGFDERCRKGAFPKFSGPCRQRLRCGKGLATGLGAFNVRFLLSPLQAPECQGFDLHGELVSGAYAISIYQNRFVLPRAYLVDDVQVVGSVREAARAVFEGGIDPSRTVVRVAPGAGPLSAADAPPPGTFEGLRADLGGCAYEPVTPARTRVRCDVLRPATLVVSQTLYPGVVVTDGGRRVEPFLANGTVLGLALSPGAHEIVVEFLPRHRHLVHVSVAAWAALACWAAASCALRLTRRLRAASRTA